MDNKKRLVDADLLLDKVRKQVARYDDPVKVVSNVLFLISEAPSVDAVPVVRCEKCKYYKANPYDPDGEKYCQYWMDWIPAYSDDFCCYGERKKQ